MKRSKYILTILGIILSVINITAQENKTLYLDESKDIQQIELTDEALLSTIKNYIIPDTVCINKKPEYVLVINCSVEEDSIVRMLIKQLPLSDICQNDVWYYEAHKIKFILKKTLPESFYKITSDFKTLSYRQYFYQYGEEGEIIRIVNPERFLKWTFKYKDSSFILEDSNCYYK